MQRIPIYDGEPIVPKTIPIEPNTLLLYIFINIVYFLLGILVIGIIISNIISINFNTFSLELKINNTESSIENEISLLTQSFIDNSITIQNQLNQVNSSSNICCNSTSNTIQTVQNNLNIFNNKSIECCDINSNNINNLTSIQNNIVTILNYLNSQVIIINTLISNTTIQFTQNVTDTDLIRCCLLNSNAINLINNMLTILNNTITQNYIILITQITQNNIQSNITNTNLQSQITNNTQTIINLNNQIINNFNIINLNISNLNNQISLISNQSTQCCATNSNNINKLNNTINNIILNLNTINNTINQNYNYFNTIFNILNITLQTQINNNTQNIIILNTIIINNFNTIYSNLTNLNNKIDLFNNQSTQCCNQSTQCCNANSNSINNLQNQINIINNNITNIINILNNDTIFINGNFSALQNQITIEQQQIQNLTQLLNKTNIEVERQKKVINLLIASSNNINGFMNPILCPLGVMATTGLFAANLINNTGPTVVNMDLDLFPNTLASMLFSDNIQFFTMFSSNPSGFVIINNPTTVIGNIGCESPSGFSSGPPSTFQGQAYFHTPETARASNDLAILNSEIVNLPCQFTITCGGSNQVLTPGVYCCSGNFMNYVSDTITFDAQGNSNAMFIIINNNAVLANIQNSNTILLNGADPSKIIWYGSCNTGFTIVDSPGNTRTLYGTFFSGVYFSAFEYVNVIGKTLNYLSTVETISASIITPSSVKNTTFTNTTFIDPVFGFPPGIYTGSLCENCANGIPLISQINSFYSCNINQHCMVDLTNTNLNRIVLRPNVYCFDTSTTLNSTIKLGGRNLPETAWIFQIYGDLTLTPNFQMILLGVYNPCNIEWVVTGNAFIGNTTLEGNLIAFGSIYFSQNSTVTGKVVSVNGAVYTNTNIINSRLCNGTQTFNGTFIPYI